MKVKEAACRNQSPDGRDLEATHFELTIARLKLEKLVKPPLELSRTSNAFS